MCVCVCVSVSAVGSDANVERDPLAGDWRIDDAHLEYFEGDALRLIKTPEAYRVELFQHGKLTVSADATKDPDSVAWVATFLNGAGYAVFKTYLTPKSNQILDVLIDFGHGDVERFSADRLFPD